jgi:hypothetical protein
MNVDTAMKIIVKPYITEKTFAMIENENKICFIVDLSAKKTRNSRSSQYTLQTKSNQSKHSKNNLR